MKITKLNSQVKNPDRINVFIDGDFRFSLDISQIIDFKIKVGLILDQDQLRNLEIESQFSKLYTKALSYCLTRPHSIWEVKQYLYRNSQPKLLKSGKKTEALPSSLSDRVVDRLISKKHLNDLEFAYWWVENRHQKQGASRLRLKQELIKKGLDPGIIDQALSRTGRQDSLELQKIIAKKALRYDSPKKLIKYLAGQGFSYDDIYQAMEDNSLN